MVLEVPRRRFMRAINSKYIYGTVGFLPEDKSACGVSDRGVPPSMFARHFPETNPLTPALLPGTGNKHRRLHFRNGNHIEAGC
jgi:hypothetical protein